MKILVSECLLGTPCRYDAKTSARLMEWFSEHGVASEDIIPVCPEVLGGLPTPRAAAEMKGPVKAVLRGSATIETRTGRDVTAPFIKGANIALELALSNGACAALLKSKSPSCGIHRIYDGSFTGTLIEGSGLTATLLREAGIVLFDETELDQLADWLAKHR